ncbi:MAG: MurR/RpiR family transcriptional regulator [Pseudomonadota bacterium]
MINRIRQLRGQFTPTEHLVADWIENNPFDVPTATLARVASQCGVSEPTVVRFCRKIGCRGFSDFRLRWAAGSGQRADAVHAEVDVEDSPAVVISKIFDSSINELQRVANGLNSERIAATAGAMARAQRIMFAGSGASAIVARDAENKFFRLGLACVALTDEPTIVQAAATCTQRDVFVAISKSGEGRALVEALQTAVRRKAVGVAMTTSGAPLANSASIAILIDAKEDTATFTPMSSRLAQLTVLDALQVCTAIQVGRSALDNLEASKIALAGIESFGGEL